MLGQLSVLTEVSLIVASIMPKKFYNIATGVNAMQLFGMINATNGILP
jgi:hypothetical protein